MQGLGKLRGSSEDHDELEGASDGEVGIDLDDCEDHEEDLEMTAAAGELPWLASTQCSGIAETCLSPSGARAASMLPSLYVGEPPQNYAPAPQGCGPDPSRSRYALAWRSCLG